ncbi:MAG: hypothetical protein LQ340_003518, partial [Diploschistes diacapsis]
MAPDLRTMSLGQPSVAFWYGRRSSLHTYGASSNPDDVPTFPLRLLIATQCLNATSAGLSEALLRWPNLVFLDLSGTYPARDANVLHSLGHMTALQVLKIRQIGLRDVGCEILADAVGTRIRSLDVRGNGLTDESVRTLLAKCFHQTRDIHTAQRRAFEAAAENEDWPTGLARSDPVVLDQFRGDDLDQRFTKRLSQAAAGRIPTEDLPATGITHLYITNNLITIEGVASLVKTKNLHVLDAGDIATTKALGRARTLSSLSSPVAPPFLGPGVEKLTGVLEKFGAVNLTSLRLHHAVLTTPANTQEEDLAELDSRSPSNPSHEHEREIESTGGSSARQELPTNRDHQADIDSDAPVYELANTAPTPRYELSAESTQDIVSPVADERSFPSDMPPPPPLDYSGSTPEADLEADDGLTPRPTSLNNFVQGINSIPPSRTASTNISNLSVKEPLTSNSAPSLLTRLISRRNSLRYAGRDPNRGLLPGRLPSLRTLTLTE